MAYLCATCGDGIISAKRPLQACVMMAFMAFPSKAFLPPPAASCLLRHARVVSTSASTSNNPNALQTRGALPPASALPPLATSSSSSSGVKARSRRTSTSLSASDSAKDAAMAAVQAAEDALSLAAEDAGEAVAGAGADEVQATVAAARAAARSAMDSLRRGGGGFGGEGGGGAQDIFASRPDVASPARSAVEAALSVIAEAKTAGPPTAASTAAYDAVGMAQAALNRRYAAPSDVGVASDASQGGGDAATGQAADSGGGNGSSSSTSGGGGSSSSSSSTSGGVFQDEAEMTKEPESARMTRDNPAASHSHMSHLLWRQVAGPGDTVLDCTAGNGYDSLEMAKIVALGDGVGKLYVMDIQERALEATRTRLRSELGEIALKRSTLIHGNFREMPAELKPMSVQLIVYNLGWLPGGDKSITTELEDTLESIEAAKRLVKSGGMISVMLYRGHAEGKRETEALLEYAAGLTHFQWRVFVHERINRPASPELLTIYRL